jgi:hypothetical protein
MEIPGPVKPGRFLLIRRVDDQRMPLPAAERRPISAEKSVLVAECVFSLRTTVRSPNTADLASNDYAPSPESAWETETPRASKVWVSNGLAFTGIREKSARGR